MNPELETVLRDAIAASPLARLIGIVGESIEDDCVRLRLPFRSEVTTIGDLVHGGAIAALVDAAATGAAWSRADLARGPRGTTIGLTVNYLNGARASEVVATARVVQRGKSIVVCDVEVTDAGGGSVARALVTYKLDHRVPRS
jgi:uncharacterized protein (TIGR00369 family)